MAVFQRIIAILNTGKRWTRSQKLAEQQKDVQFQENLAEQHRAELEETRAQQREIEHRLAWLQSKDVLRRRGTP